MASARTLYDKIWEAHVVREQEDGTSLLYVDRHLVHEVSSAQAFDGLRARGLPVRRPDLTLAMPDHNVPTTKRLGESGDPLPIEDPASALQLATLESNVAEFGVPFFEATSRYQGIVHVVGPELGFTLPGCTLVCGDSHTSAHGALGCLAFGIGTTEVEQVLSTQTLRLTRSKTMEIRLEGELARGITAKDVILSIIGRIGTDGGIGHVIEFRGEAFRRMTIEERLTVCNMAIEAGARSGLVAPDDATYRYLKGRPMAPQGGEWDRAVAHWKSLATDEGARFDRSLVIDAAEIVPVVTWGTSPEDVVSVTGRVPDPLEYAAPAKREAVQAALDYMGLTPGQRMRDIEIEHVFIGSCTNSRIEDLRAAAAILAGRKLAPNIRSAIVVPGSGLVKLQAEHEGLDAIFKAAGFEWREPGCSACLGMNPDKVPPRERCASTSNRNFVGRQGPEARTHLVSPSMAAASAVAGRLADVRDYAGDAG